MSYRCPYCHDGWIPVEDADPVACPNCENTGWLNDDEDRRIQAEETKRDIEIGK